MNVLILGVSNIALRRVIPALVSLKPVEKIHLASRRTLGPTVVPPDKQGLVFQGYERALAESTLWAYHPRFTRVQDLLATHSERLTRVTATFSFPPLPPNNFRNCPQLGGGCLLDLGPYAASCGRYFFGGPAEEVVGRILTRDANTGLETSFSLLATCSGGRAFVGHKRSSTPSRNRLGKPGATPCSRMPLFYINSKPQQE